MKKRRILLFFVSFILIFYSHSNPLVKAKEVEEAQCELASREMNFYDRKLSDYLAQEYIGSDLAREEILDRLIKTKSLPENLITVIDFSLQDTHGVSVLNLISHSGKQAILPFSPDITNHWLGNGWDLGGLRNMTTIKNILDSQKPYSFINSSSSWTRFRQYFVFKGLSDRGTVLIKSLGNHFPFNMFFFEAKALMHLNVIGVGSLNPFGDLSSFSTEAEDESFTIILAPSDNLILTKDARGEESIFGGTSGAAPLVTGTLAAFEWIVGRKQTFEELKIILNHTFIPSITSHQEPRRNGMGVLNTYKIIKTAEKISSHCHGAINEEQRKACIESGIRNSNTYKFQKLSNLKLKNMVEQYFP